MELGEVNQTIDRIDAFFGTSIRNGRFADENKLKHWQIELGKLNVSYTETTLRRLEDKETGAKSPSKPTLARFMSEYRQVRGISGKSNQKPITAIHSDCCRSGYRLMIFAGKQHDLKPLNIKKLSRQADDAGTVYDVYQLVSQPCSCKTGQHINKGQKHLNYDFGKLQDITAHSFCNDDQAQAFYDDHLLPLTNIELRY